MQKLRPAAADADAEAVSFPAYQTDRPHSRNIPDHPPQMWPGWDMNQSLPYGEAGYPQTGYPQIGTNMNQGSTVWPIVNCPDTTAGYLEQHHPVAMAYVPWQQWQTAYAPERGLMQGTIFPDLDLPFNYGRCGR